MAKIGLLTIGTNCGKPLKPATVTLFSWFAVPGESCKVLKN
jgi:hypothetical protein